MINLNASPAPSQRRSQRMLYQYIGVAMFSIFAAIAGLVPDQSGIQVWGGAVQAQQKPTFTDAEISNYARAVLGIEPRRQAAYDEIRGIAGGSVPAVVCHETRNINRLGRNIREIAVNYCNKAKEIIETNGLTVSRFNDITKSQQADPALQQRIQAELQRLQQSPSK